MKTHHIPCYDAISHSTSHRPVVWCYMHNFNLSTFVYYLSIYLSNYINIHICHITNIYSICIWYMYKYDIPIYCSSCLRIMTDTIWYLHFWFGKSRHRWWFLPRATPQVDSRVAERAWLSCNRSGWNDICKARATLKFHNKVNQQNTGEQELTLSIWE